MAFWGIEVKPGKPYTYKHSDEQGRLHLSQATLGTGKSTKKSIVQCNVGDKKPIYLCSLVPERIENCVLNLEFEEDDEVTFSIVGPHTVHLSGFFFGVSQHDTVRDDFESDSYGEDIAETESEESTDYDTEDEYEDDFIDDDFGGFPPSPVPKSGVVIEEILDDDKPTNENGMSKDSKRPKKKNHAKVSDGTDGSQRQIVVKSRSGVAVLESEDEDGFPISSTRNSKTDVLKDNGNTEETKDDREDEEVKKKKAKDDHKSLKRKADAVVPDDEKARETGQVTAEVHPENDLKKKKRKNKKKATLKEETTKDIDQDLPVGEEHDQKQTTDKSLEVDADSTGDANHPKENKKRKKKKKTKKQESEANANTSETVTKNDSTVEIDEKSEDKAFQMRSFPNGLAIEELAMGKPDGKKASPGRQVSVHYIGKLKNNGKIFDSNVGRAPFKFRLGVGQVIKGWDVGVNGMRVGDKRRLTIPPAMGYGARGAGPAIPPNSWLVFDVELVDVR